MKLAKHLPLMLFGVSVNGISDIVRNNMSRLLVENLTFETFPDMSAKVTFLRQTSCWQPIILDCDNWFIVLLIPAKERNF